MRLTSNNGFSLLEMMVSIGIFSIISAGIFSVFYVGNISWSLQDANVNVQSQARRTVSKLSRDLRIASGLTITQDADNVDVSFSKSGSAITYAWTTDAGSTRHQIVRAVDGVSIVTAQNITALSLTETATDIKINVTASDVARGKTLEYTLVGNVAKR